jgi:hypothetical protein
MEHQARELAAAVSVFKLRDGGTTPASGDATERPAVWQAGAAHSRRVAPTSPRKNGAGTDRAAA